MHAKIIFNSSTKSTLSFKYTLACHNCNNICTISAIKVANAAPYKLYRGIKNRFSIMSTIAPVITALMYEISFPCGNKI